MFAPNSNHWTFVCSCLLLVVPVLRSLAADPPVEVALLPENTDSPVWEPTTKSIYFAGNTSGMIYRYHPETNKFFCTSIEGVTQVSFVVPVVGGNRFAAGADTSVIVFTWDGTTNSSIKPDKTITTNGSVLTGKTDALGRFWVGTDLGGLSSIAPNGDPTLRMEDAGKPLGIGWNVFGTKMYYACGGYSFSNIYERDFTMDSALVGPKDNLIIDLSKHSLTSDPYGLSVDAQNNLWIATWGNTKVVKIDPTKKSILLTIDVPHTAVSSVTFGGPDLDILYVTSCQLSSTPAPKLFKITGTGAKGIPIVPANINP